MGGETPKSDDSTIKVQTLVVSDLHITESEPKNKKRPLWKRYKQQDFFFDEALIRCIEFVERQPCVDGHPVKTELVLNGDTFDFDSVTQTPADGEHHISLAHKKWGLGSQEWMSNYKIDRIIEEHRWWLQQLGDFIQRGNSVVFVIGNHDLELHWPSVQDRIVRAMDLPDEARNGLRFCSWFYLSGGDTFITHGHQLDAMCSVRDPVNPFIQLRGNAAVRLPFGEHASRCMLNSMGYFNPHATKNYIMSTKEYLKFFTNYMIKTQPLIVITWFTGAIATFVKTTIHHMLPPMRDPLFVEEKTEAIAANAQVTPAQVRRLSAASTPPASANPLKILRELWLDRALLIIFSLLFGVQFILALNMVWPISPWWALGPALLLSPVVFIYAHSVHSSVFATPLLSKPSAKLLSTITGVNRIVLGHNHVPECSKFDDVEYLNSGSWSPAYSEPECINRIGTPTFVWIGENEHKTRRTATLWRWPNGALEPVPFTEE
jgi:UDP-2,3-diacylglucosamine pyrophosphatase LpxH